jgi:imidazolonepropionase-like amidohydrolase
MSASSAWERVQGEEKGMSRIVLENCTLLDGTSPDLRHGMQVLVEGERIREVSETPIAAAGMQTLDLKGKTLMPGLIDAHAHLIATTLNLGQLAHEPATLTTARARHIAEGMLRRGFTTIRDAGGADWGLAAAIEYGLIDGPRVFYAGRALSQTGGHGDFRPRTWEADHCACCMAGTQFSVIADGVAAVQRAAREELRRGASQIKIMASGGVASPTDPVWNLQYSEEEIRAIVWEAQSWQTYVMAHAYTPEAVSRCVRYGVRSIEHGNLIDAATAALMASAGAFLVPTLVTYEALHREGKQWGLPQVSIDKIKGVREAGLHSLEHARAAGVKMGFGTDLLGETHHYQSLEFSIRAQVLSPFEVIQSATLTNAELLNRCGELGVLAPGALADLIAVNGNPLQDLTLLQEQGKHLSLIMKGGKIYKNEVDS